MSPTWTLHADGTFDLTAPGLRLLGARPAFDHQPMACRAVAVAGNTLTYTLAEGTLRLELTQDARGLSLRARLEGVARAPHWLHPLFGARVEGVAQFFRTGVGFSGPTNFIELAGQPDLYAFESYALTGLVTAEGGTLAIGVHGLRDYQQKTSLHNRVLRRNFRNREVAANLAFLEAGFSTEGIAVPAGGLELPELRFAWAAKPWDSLRGMAEAMGAAAGARLHEPSGYHWCSWYNRASFFTHEELTVLLQELARNPEPLQFMQIDAGYEAAAGDWLLSHRQRWPQGLAAALAEIRQHGHRPGIWIAPYMVHRRSELFRQHPDWVIHDLEGKPLAAWQHYDGSVENEETYVLDTSHPEAFASLRHVFQTFCDWGCEFFKTDFLEWGWKDSTTVRRHTPGKTAAQYHDDVARMIREVLGHRPWLACISYFAPYIGHADQMRVSSDTGVRWDGSGGTGNDGVGGGVGNVVSETYHCQVFNNAWWQNDPDSLFLRDYFLHLTPPEIEALAYFCGVLGVAINTSDYFHRLPADRRALWRFIEPQPTRWTAALPYFGQPRPTHVAVRAYPEHRAWAVVILNPGAAPVLDRARIRELIGHDSITAFEWSHREAPRPLGTVDQLLSELPAHHARLVYLSETGTPPPAALSLGGAVWRR